MIGLSAFGFREDGEEKKIDYDYEDENEDDERRAIGGSPKSGSQTRSHTPKSLPRPSTWLSDDDAAAWFAARAFS